MAILPGPLSGAICSGAITTRGVTRLDGARVKKQVWRAHVQTWALSEANLLYWRKYLQQYQAPLAVIRRPFVGAREIVPPCPPSFRPC